MGSLLSFRKTIIQSTKHANDFKITFDSTVFVFTYSSMKQHCFFSLSMFFSSSSVPALVILNVHTYICSVQPKATHQLTSTPPWPMASPSSVLGLPGQSTHSSTGWALSQVDDYIFFFLLLFKSNFLQFVFQA